MSEKHTTFSQLNSLLHKKPIDLCQKQGIESFLNDLGTFVLSFQSPETQCRRRHPFPRRYCQSGAPAAVPGSGAPVPGDGRRLLEDLTSLREEQELLRGAPERRRAAGVQMGSPWSGSTAPALFWGWSECGRASGLYTVRLYTVTEEYWLSSGTCMCGHAERRNTLCKHAN